MDSTGPQRQLRLMRTLRATAVGCGLLAPLATVATVYADMVFLLGALTLPGWVVGLALSALAAVSFIAVAALHAYGGKSLPAEERGAHLLTGRWRSVMAMGSAFSAMSVTGAFLIILTANHVIVSTDYVRLAPSGPHRCQVVARETSLWLGGGGALYAVNRWGVGRKTGDYSSDDGLHPFSTSGYVLTWHGDSASVEFNLHSIDGAWPSPQTVNC